ncbi:MAG: methyltransferase type 12 [Anaerocolumna sp.]|nr:methyltransferase type 12 [Anaerocolumna sp.]
MGNTDIFDLMANDYDTSDRIQIAKIASDAIRENLVASSNKTADLHVDYIFMVQVLLHIKDIEVVLSRLYDLLNNGGHLIIVDFNKNENVVSDMVHNGFDQLELIKHMKRLGFIKSQSKTFYTGSKIFMNQDASLFILDAQKLLV